MALPDDSSPAVPVYHLITPGDHFSPRTGSAIPTVVDGLARASVAAGAGRRYSQHVVLQGDTYRPRYGSAEAIEYRGVPAPDMRARLVDAARARIGVPRRAAAAYFAPAVRRLLDEPAGIVLAHNAPIVPLMLRDQEHVALLYAHNDVLRRYSAAECSRILGDRGVIISVSDALGAHLRERLPRSLRDRIRTVINGVDTTQFSPAESRIPGPLRVMFLGRTIEDKGADILLEAAAMIRDADIAVHIVGSQGFDPDAPLSPFEHRLRELAEHVAGPVVFEPFVSRTELPGLLHRADILVVPSRWPDPCPLTVGEGMATGIPIVAARVGGIPELLGDAGLLFDPARPAELADALERLIASSSARRDRARAALERARARDWTWAWRNLARVLDDVGPG